MVQIIDWRRSGEKPLSEPMMVSLRTHIYVTRPQLVNKMQLTRRSVPVMCLTVLTLQTNWYDDILLHSVSTMIMMRITILMIMVIIMITIIMIISALMMITTWVTPDNSNAIVNSTYGLSNIAFDCGIGILCCLYKPKYQQMERKCNVLTQGWQENFVSLKDRRVLQSRRCNSKWPIGSCDISSHFNYWCMENITPRILLTPKNMLCHISGALSVNSYLFCIDWYLVQGAFWKCIMA